MLAAGALLLAGLAACSSGTEPASSASTVAASPTIDAGAPPTDVPTTTVATSTTVATATNVAALSPDEVAGLVWMREEEQLARDVYVALGQQWGTRVFENIAGSESSHLDAVATLLERYGIDDPAADHQAGVFTDPRIQALYDQLMAAGRLSLVDALRVGAQIEEIDIVDLQARAGITDEADILAVYANLEKGSRNHLRAFTSQLSSRDETYVPSSLGRAAYDAIVSGAIERGPEG